MTSSSASAAPRRRKQRPQHDQYSATTDDVFRVSRNNNPRVEDGMFMRQTPHRPLHHVNPRVRYPPASMEPAATPVTPLAPLVLDPTAYPPPGSTESTASATARPPGVMNSLLRSAARGMGVANHHTDAYMTPQTHHHHPQTASSFSPSRNNTHPQQHRKQQSASNDRRNNNVAHETAADFARTCPRAGFLQKLGTNVPEFKRRFFLLKPSTTLYYFLSPHDSVPRGSMNVENAQVEELEHLPDGRYRFALWLPQTQHGGMSQQPQRVVLEARSKEVGLEWLESLHKERLSYARSQVAELERLRAQDRAEIEDLKRQIEHFQMVEEDRDGALEDAARWKQQFEELDEALRVLTNHIRRFPHPTTATTTEAESEQPGDDNPPTSSLAETWPQNQRGTDDAANKNHGEQGSIVANTDGRGQGDADITVTSTCGPGNDRTKQRCVEDVAVVVDDKEEGGLNGDYTHCDEAAEMDNQRAKIHRHALDSDDNQAPEAQANNDFVATENHRAVDFIPKPEENLNVSLRDTSLLDDDAAVEAAEATLQDHNIIDELHAPGKHFSALVNACQQLRENLRLASEEASHAVEDYHVAHDNVKAMKKRLEKAEQKLCQLWEENCSIRKTLKQKKREKRVLVREVRSLMETQAKQMEKQTLMQQQQLAPPSTKPMNPNNRIGLQIDDDASTMVGSDDEKLNTLITELEEDVISSIRLHGELFMATSGGGGDIGTKTKRDEAETQSKEPRTVDSDLVQKEISFPNVVDKVDNRGAGILSCSSTATTSVSTQSGPFSLHRRDSDLTGTSSSATTVNHMNGGGTIGGATGQGLLKRSGTSDKGHATDAAFASLFDSSSSDSETENDVDEVEGSQHSSDAIESARRTPKPSEHGVFSKRGQQENDLRSVSSSVAASCGGSSSTPGRSQSSSPLRPNPVLQLDDVSVVEDVVSLWKPINLSEHSNATSRLVCPLADVVDTKATVRRSGTAQSHQEELQIYHVTFYTRKIGLQFQKVPPPPPKSKGLLTAAMTADLAGDAHGSSKTAAELKKVAAIHNWANSTKDGPAKADECLQVATPIDAVHVCGFDGFDDSGTNVRPKLGARLVAFDGVSVEIGKWTFDSIRKAIQARGRPLTLSFRNDFLSTEQRAIMTKAVAEVEKKQAASTRADHHHHRVTRSLGQLPVNNLHRPASEVPSLQSVISHETDHFVNESAFEVGKSGVISDESHFHDDFQEGEGDAEDDLTVSSAGQYSTDYHPFQASLGRHGYMSSGGSYQGSHSGGSYSYRSFSDVGSSASALSSAIGPLMSNLMNGFSSNKKKNFSPNYLHRQAASVADTPEHQDFQSNLL